jgi:hypothetical protein
MPADTTGVFVEIGSDRHEGSTPILANLAKQHNTKLITVDVSDFAKHQLEDQFDNIEFVIQTGSELLSDYFHLQILKRISNREEIT